MASQFDKITSINSPGWDGVNSNVEPFRKNKNEQNELDVAFSQCFQTKAGQIVLDYLNKKTIEQPAWVPGAEASYGYAREGQNSIVREIKQRMERNYGRNTSTTPRE